MSLLDSMRASRKNPSVLKLKLLKIRGEDADVLVFFYEGPEDVPVYEEWMTRLQRSPSFEPVAGSGKEQLLAFHKQLSDSADPALDKVYFFIDRDFDLPHQPSEHVYELDAYSIENLICTEEVLESILRDEFRRTGAIDERTRIRAHFQGIWGQFQAHCEPVNFLLFAAQRSKCRVVKKPEKVTEIAQITLANITAAYRRASDIVEIENMPATPQLQALRQDFDALPIQFRERGKYLYEAFRRWLRVLADDLKSPAPTLFSTSDERLAGDPWTISLRRLASSAPAPQSLVGFVEGVCLRHTVQHVEQRAALA